jgi:hypothetical protein
MSTFTRLLGPALLLVLALVAATPSVPPLIITDAVTGKPIAYASLGIQYKPIGTVADAAGHVALAALRAAAPTDTLVVSCVGYQSRKVLVSQLSREATLRLRPVATALAEVVVHSRLPNQVVLGHRNASVFTSFGFYTTTDTAAHSRLGREMGVLLNVHHSTELQSFRVLTFGRDFQTVTFRLNIYAVRNGLPASTLLQRDIIFTVNGQQRGWTEVDLRPYAIRLAGGQQVVAAIEWLANVPSQRVGGFLNVPGHVSATHSLFMRDKSAQSWRKMGLNPNLYFTGIAYPE